MQAIEAKKAKEQQEIKEPEKKVSRAEKKKIEFDKKWKAQVCNVLFLFVNNLRAKSPATISIFPLAVLLYLSIIYTILGG